MPGKPLLLIAAATVFSALAVSVGEARAHCDGLDGPVVTAARHALERGDVNRVLIWVRVEDEEEIRTAFDQAMMVRALGDEARALADRYFFETLVRIHRAGEGAPFAGLKPAGRDLGPAIPAADKAIETGSPDAIMRLLTEEMRKGIRGKLKTLTDLKEFAPEDVSAGRDYVESYVAFIHYAERLYEAASKSAHGHMPEKVR